MTSRNVHTGLITVLHLLVDGLCACCLVMLADALEISGSIAVFVLYNVIAFGTQPLTGHWTDSTKRPLTALGASALLLLCGALTCLTFVYCGQESLPLFGATLLGLGNSLFHVYGGKYVATTWQGDIRPMGIFVSTGALGLTIGSCFGSVALLATLLLALLTVVWMHAKSAQSSINQVNINIMQLRRKVYTLPLLFLLCLMFVVAGRSFVGTATPSLGTSSSALLLLVSAVAMTGKAAGGFLSVRFGLRRTLIVSLVLGCACLMLCPLQSAFIPVTVFLINLSMPCTLYLANRAMPGREALAFGLLAAALLPGYYIGTSCVEHPLFPQMLTALLGTILIESLLLLYMRERRWQVLTASVVMNLLTNVPLNLVALTSHATLPRIVGMECLVVLVEFLAYWAVLRDRRTAFTYSLICNVASYLAGLTCQLAFPRLSTCINL